ncbi:class II glutamine amidotransferase [bacterium]|nr:class II glutamine amidotransferase [bacterium]
MTTRSHIVLIVVIVSIAVCLVLCCNGPVTESLVLDIRDSRENCRLLGIVNGKPPDTDAIARILKDFSNPSYPQSSGWSISAYSNYERGGYLSIPLEPMIIRSQTPILEDQDTWECVANLVTRLKPEIVIGHLRNASSGCAFLADPHPFEMKYKTRTYLFSHNGGVWGKDLDYLKNHLITADMLPKSCPDNPIDSEFLFIYLMQLIEQNDGDVWNAIYNWAFTLTDTFLNDWNALNIMLTDGNIIWTVRISYKPNRFPLQYVQLPESSGFAISTQALGPGWTPMNNFTVAKFRAGHPIYMESIPHPKITELQIPHLITHPESLQNLEPEQ